MLALEQIKEIAKTKNVIFYKDNCPFCEASEHLMNALVNKSVINKYSIYYLNKDFDNQNLKDLALSYDWVPKPFQEFPTKPQIFIDGKYIGGNKEFYLSEFNEAETGPKLQNPMPI